jgi:intracellular septation protein
MPAMKMLLELGPLLIFFTAFKMLDIYWATGIFMAATVVSLIASWLILKKVPVMTMVTGILVMVFGGFTIYLHDSTFIKIKVTIIYVLFAGGLAIGLALGQSFIKVLLGEALRMEDEGWRKLTIRWIYFFVMLAVANEVIWRNFSEDLWMKFKVFGILPLTFLFMMAQVGLLQKYEMHEKVVDVDPLK